MDTPDSPLPPTRASRPADRWSAALSWLIGVGLSLAAAFVFHAGYLVVTAVVVVFAIVAAITKRISEQRPIAFLVGWLSPPAFFVGCILVLTGAVGDYIHSRPFDRDAWLSTRDAPHGDRTRFRMVDELRDSHRLDRLTREQAVALLGEPAARQWRMDANEVVWRLGPAGFGVDDVWLLLRFGPDGRLVSHDIVMD